MSIWNIANPNLKTLVPYEPGKPVEDVARELGLDPAQIIKLASNENPLGPSPKALEAMRASLTQSHIYPDGGGFHLRNAIAEKQGLHRNNIILGNGSNEIIEFAFHAFTRAGSGSIVASRYSFAVYKLMAAMFDVELIEVADRDFHHDLEAMLAAIRPDTRLVFVTSPNNPTGTRLSNQELSDFLNALPPHVVAVFDEAYYEFIDNPPPSSRWVAEGKQLIVMRTFSKIQGLAGLRIGYGMAREDIAEVLQRCRQPFNASAPAQAAALAGLLDEDHQKKTKDLTIKGRDRLAAFFQQQNIPFVPSEANFIMARTGEADSLFKKLLQQGVIVRSMTSYGLPEWIRVSIGTPAEMERFEHALTSCRA